MILTLQAIQNTGMKPEPASAYPVRAGANVNASRTLQATTRLAELLKKVCAPWSQFGSAETPGKLNSGKY